MFVSHEGKKELRVETYGNRYAVDFTRMAHLMGSVLRRNVRRYEALDTFSTLPSVKILKLSQVKDSIFCDWVLAEVSTTTDVNRSIYVVEVVATLKRVSSPLIAILVRR